MSAEQLYILDVPGFIDDHLQDDRALDPRLFCQRRIDGVDLLDDEGARCLPKRERVEA